MYYPDLSPADERTVKQFRMRSWENYDFEGPLLLVGWLDAGQPYSKGEASPEFVETLRGLCQTPTERWKGSHACPFCGNNPVIQSNGERMLLGSADIEVVTEDAVYYAPAMTLHYVIEHEYRPPQVFMDAVLEIEERGKQKAKISYRGRIEAKDDDRVGDLLSNPCGGDDLWVWPLERKPNAEGLSETVDIFRYELFALLVQKELAELDRRSVVGGMNLAEWIEGKVNLKMGELRETTPGQVFPRLKSAFYLQTMSNPNEILECIVAAQQTLYDIVFGEQYGTGQSIETWLKFLRESANK